MNQKGVKRISVEQIRENFDNVFNEIKEHTKDREVYVSVDIDVLDSGLINATGYPVSGGLTKEELIDMINACKEGNVICSDLVEYNPLKDENGKSLFVVKEILSCLKS